MRKLQRIAVMLVTIALLLLMAGCTPADDAAYELVFGKSASELIPSIGNAAYVDRPLTPEAEQAQEEQAAADSDSSSASEDTYVDPTAGLDCAEE